MDLILLSPRSAWSSGRRVRLLPLCSVVMSWFVVIFFRPGVPFPPIPFVPSLLLRLLRFLALSDPLSRRVLPLCTGEGDLWPIPLPQLLSPSCLFQLAPCPVLSLQF
jgi:hypothetical protein